jgi:predicted nucleic acid-binding protein
MLQSSFLLYIETNFLMSIATGRDPRADALLAKTPQGLRLAIPQVCFMEALSVSGRVEKQRSELTNRLEREIAQVRRDLTSPNARDLLPLLERANIANQELIKDVSTRLFGAIHVLGQTAELITISGAILDASRESVFIADNADNLILHCILSHARSDSQTTKIFLTENRKDFGTTLVQDQLKSAGVDKSFWRTNDFSQWLSSQPSDDDSSEEGLHGEIGP